MIVLKKMNVLGAKSGKDFQNYSIRRKLSEQTIISAACVQHASEWKICFFSKLVRVSTQDNKIVNVDAFAMQNKATRTRLKE